MALLSSSTAKQDKALSLAKLVVNRSSKRLLPGRAGVRGCRSRGVAGTHHAIGVTGYDGNGHSQPETVFTKAVSDGF